jgi:hypothetical protein
VSSSLLCMERSIPLFLLHPSGVYCNYTLRFRGWQAFGRNQAGCCMSYSVVRIPYSVYRWSRSHLNVTYPAAKSALSLRESVFKKNIGISYLTRIIILTPRIPNTEYGIRYTEYDNQVNNHGPQKRHTGRNPLFWE